MTNEENAKEIAEEYGIDFPESHSSARPLCYKSAMAMAQWKDKQFKEQLTNLKDEIQSNLCASSGFNDEYSSGYQDCGMKVMEMIDKILNK